MGFGVWGLGFGVLGVGFGASGLDFGVWGFGVWGLGFEVRGVDVLRFWGFGFGVLGLGFESRVCGTNPVLENGWDPGVEPVATVADLGGRVKDLGSGFTV